MKHLMYGLGVNALVIPNGLAADAFLAPEQKAVAEFRSRLSGRTVVTKMARWDPDKRWLLAIDTLRVMKRLGWKPLFIARGGMEAHGSEVMQAARAADLRIAERPLAGCGVHGLLHTMEGLQEVDLLSLRSPIDPESRKVLFRGASAVLANSGHEPFGLVGLETMAAGGIACTGCSGEDFAIPGKNALVLETNDPWEFVGLFENLRDSPNQERALRQAGQRTAQHYAWPQIIRRILLPRLQLQVQEPLTTSMRKARLQIHAA
jgi:glycosyltransferase involved in cell wall biosynthesis